MAIPEEAVQFNNHSYQLVDDGMTWEEAKVVCENKGGHLVVITSEEEQNFVCGLLDNGTRNSYWMGGFKNVDGSWQWITDENFSYTNWAPEDPNNAYGNENVLMMYRNINHLYSNPNQLGDWNDLRADGTFKDGNFFGTENFGYICEWDSVTESNIDEIIEPPAPPALPPSDDDTPKGDDTPKSGEKLVIGSGVGRIMLAQWSYSFTLTKESPLFGGTISNAD